MSRPEWQKLVSLLDGIEYQFGLITPATPTHRIRVAPGLTDDEVATVEQRFAFRFPPDLRGFLQTALLSGPQFPDWRAGDPDELRDWLNRPARGVLFDVSNGFWLDAWGPRPLRREDALAQVEALLLSAPVLIPVYGHRMIPADPSAPGNPVLSIHQTDIIYYGFDLSDYLRNEFRLGDQRPWPTEPRPIRFWQDLLS